MTARIAPWFGLALWLASAAAGAQEKPDLSGTDPHWIEDARAQCWAANPTPEPGESIDWMGACVGGLISGDGTLTWYANGRVVGRDQGYFKNGELSGHGRIDFADGASFEGEFPGAGTLTLPDGGKVTAMSVHETAGWSIEEVRPAPGFNENLLRNFGDGPVTGVHLQQGLIDTGFRADH